VEEHVKTLLDSLNCPVSWGRLGQGTALPRIVLQVVSGDGAISLDGATGETSGRIQVDCYGKTHMQAGVTAREVRTLLDGYRGGPVKVMKFTAVRDHLEGGDDDAVPRRSMDFAINYRG
jgi:hypothetical protein